MPLHGLNDDALVIYRSFQSHLQKVEKSDEIDEPYVYFSSMLILMFELMQCVEFADTKKAKLNLDVDPDVYFSVRSFECFEDIIKPYLDLTLSDKESNIGRNKNIDNCEFNYTYSINSDRDIKIRERLPQVIIDSNDSMKAQIYIDNLMYYLKNKMKLNVYLLA